MTYDRIPQNPVICLPAGEFCSLDSTGKRVKNRTIGEMEQEFLEALSSYYYGDKPDITDEEFEVLKDELIWSGSKVGNAKYNSLLLGFERQWLLSKLAGGSGQQQ